MWLASVRSTQIERLVLRTGVARFSSVAGRSGLLGVLVSSPLWSITATSVEIPSAATVGNGPPLKVAPAADIRRPEPITSAWRWMAASDASEVAAEAAAYSPTSAIRAAIPSKHIDRSVRRPRVVPRLRNGHFKPVACSADGLDRVPGARITQFASDPADQHLDEIIAALQLETPCVFEHLTATDELAPIDHQILQDRELLRGQLLLYLHDLQSVCGSAVLCLEPRVPPWRMVWQGNRPLRLRGR